jgi:hypothetical protein
VIWSVVIAVIRDRGGCSAAAGAGDAVGEFEFLVVQQLGELREAVLIVDGGAGGVLERGDVQGLAAVVFAGPAEEVTDLVGLRALGQPVVEVGLGGLAQPEVPVGEPGQEPGGGVDLLVGAAGVGARTRALLGAAA